jgi:GT2 family glycosyltransferase
MNTEIKISAVVIAYHGIDFIPDCLESLTADLAPYPHEIIVVDNHSTDGTVEYIEQHYPEIRLVKNSRNAGFARAINQGIEATRHELLWLLNQDIRIRRGCLAALLKCRLTIDRPGVIGPRLVGFDGTLQKVCRRFPRYHHLLFELTGLAYLFPRSGLFNGWKMGEFDHAVSRAVEQPMGAAMLVSRECIDDIGMLDESFGIFFNDVDFCLRLSRAGYTNYYCADAVIEHYVGGSVSRHKPKMVWLSHYSMYRYFLKQEKRREAALITRLIRLPLPHLAGLFLLLAAVPRSLYHLLKRLFH